MNRFIRNNLLLVIVLGISVLAVCVLLVFAMMEYVRMGERIAGIDSLRKKIETLVKKNPAPVEGNKALIQQDIDSYQKASEKLLAYFINPMQAAGDTFISTLKLVNPEKDDKGNVIPITREKFVNDFNEMWNKSGEHNYAQKNFAFRTFRRRFANWNSALAQFVQQAKNNTTEPLSLDNQEGCEELLLSVLGIPRRMVDNPEKLERFMRNYQGALVKMMSEVKFDNSAVWFGFTPEIAWIRTVFPNAAEQYPSVARAWNMLGDIIKMVAEAKIETLLGLWFRNSVDGKKDGLTGGIAGEEAGGFRIFRFRLEVAGKMQTIRKLVKLLDESYLRHRFYVIRSVALYAGNDGANEIFIKAAESLDEELGKEETAVKVEEAAPVRGRRGRRGAVVQEVKKELTAAEIQAKAKADAEKKRLENERSSKFQYFERIGYGDVLIGNFDTCRAIIDFDYVARR